jgi:hypothetical protein
MKCDECGTEMRKEHPVQIWEPGKPGIALCQKCWHRAMGHKESQLPVEVNNRNAPQTR